ncbi:MAG: long-chain fatty acid--CoA ligase, partial [Paramuribaculum sp.]|nr:long-chain fatty acid--CoA ligase [Paramuribaculum sp.]
GKSADEISNVISEDIKLLNKTLPGYSQVRNFRLMDQEFQKTPKRSIKRFLYTADTLHAS